MRRALTIGFGVWLVLLNGGLSTFTKWSPRGSRSCRPLRGKGLRVPATSRSMIVRRASWYRDGLSRIRRSKAWTRFGEANVVGWPRTGSRSRTWSWEKPGAGRRCCTTCSFPEVAARTCERNRSERAPGSTCTFRLPPGIPRRTIERRFRRASTRFAWTSVPRRRTSPPIRTD